MRRILYLTIAAVLGAGSYLAYHELSAPREAAPPGPDPSIALDPGRETILPRPILSEESEAPPPGPPPASPGPEAPGKSTEVSGKKQEEPPPAPPQPPAPGAEKPALSKAPPAAPVKSEPQGLDDMIRISKAAFAAGDTTRGVKLLREIFQSAKDRADVDIVPQARQLLEAEERGPSERPQAPGGSDLKIELCRYLEARDVDPAWRYRTSLALGGAEARNESAPEDLKSAWKHLTAAYFAAEGAPARQKVMEVLRPFLTRHIFSKRFSPLVETCTVKEGDSLNRIARARGTTEEAIQRLNQLKGDVIQPGQRLILLPGKPRIFVKKSEFRLWVMLEDRLLLEFPIGLGRDNSTPAVVFLIRDRQKDPIWYRRGEPPIPAGDPHNILGSRWLGFKNTAELSGFGIHGTADPTSIGKEASSGCIRLKKEDIEVLWDLIPAGTEVEVKE